MSSDPNSEAPHLRIKIVTRHLIEIVIHDDIVLATAQNRKQNAMRHLKSNAHTGMSVAVVMTGCPAVRDARWSLQAPPGINAVMEAL